MSRFVLFLTALAGCASTSEAPPQVARQSQAIQLAPAPSSVVPKRRDVTGTYRLELEGQGELAGRSLRLVLRREQGELTAECRAGRWSLAGAVEGGGMGASDAGLSEPLAMSMLGLSPVHDAPVALRLIAARDSSASGEELRGTAIVERGGVVRSMPFAARRTGPVERSRPLCGALMWSHHTRYHGPDDGREVTTRRFEGCVEVSGASSTPGGRAERD